MAHRQARIRESVQLQELDAFLCTNPIHLRYLFGFTGSSGAALISTGEAVLLVDSRYTEQASTETAGCRVIQVGRQLWGKELSGLAPEFRRIGFEAEHLTFQQVRELGEQSQAGERLQPVCGIVERLRIIKDSEEIRRIRSALDASRQALDELFSEFPWGAAENQVAAKLDFLCRQRGASGPSFDTIVLSGGRSSLPHGRPGSLPVLPDQVLLIDFGLRLDGYCSDLTRTLVPARHEATELFAIVTAAQEAAVRSIRPDVPVQDVDRAARQVIEQAGYGDCFGHGTGHGIGLEIHEAPRISPMGSGKLAAGMVFTVEPGVYLKGRMGVRIEDVVAVTETGCEVLSR